MVLIMKCSTVKSNISLRNKKFSKLWPNSSEKPPNGNREHGHGTETYGMVQKDSCASFT